MSPNGHDVPLRRAALTLHAFAQQDRAWMLNSLPEEDRQSLGRLLAELEELGIPQDPALAAAVLPESAGRREEGDCWLEGLQGAAVIALERVLAREPAAVTRALLSMQPWPWRAQLLAATDACRRAELELERTSCTPRSAMTQALLVALKKEVASEPAPASVKASRWHLAWRRIRRSA